MDVRARILGDTELIARTSLRAAALPKEVATLVQFWGQMLNTRIKAKASGRPGPNAPTGNYRRSWVHVFERTADGARSVNGTNMPQGRRLEFGFTGVDSIGRHYDQPPYAHVGPAKDEIEGPFVKAHETLIRSI